MTNRAGRDDDGSGLQVVAARRGTTRREHRRRAWGVAAARARGGARGPLCIGRGAQGRLSTHVEDGRQQRNACVLLLESSHNSGLGLSLGRRGLERIGPMG